MCKDIDIAYDEVTIYDSELAEKNLEENDFSGSDVDGIGGE